MNYPQYRLEHRHPDLSPLIVAYAETLRWFRTTVLTQTLAHKERGILGEIAVVDQDTEVDVLCRTISARRMVMGDEYLNAFG